MKVYAIVDEEDDITVGILTEEQRDEFLRKFPGMADVCIKPFELGNLNGIHIDDTEPFDDRDLYIINFKGKSTVILSVRKWKKNIYHLKWLNRINRNYSVPAENQYSTCVYAEDEDHARFEAVKIMIEFLDKEKEKI